MQAPSQEKDGWRQALAEGGSLSSSLDSKASAEGGSIDEAVAQGLLCEAVAYGLQCYPKSWQCCLCTSSLPMQGSVKEPYIAVPARAMRIA